MKSLSKYKKGIKYLLCAIDLFSKYTWIAPIKDKKGARIVNAFKTIISKERKPNKIWVDQGSEFYNNTFTDFLKINNIGIYSTYNEGKSVVAIFVFVISNIKNTVPWTYIISDLNGEETTGSFYEKELQKTNQKEFRIEKVLKRKGDKRYVKWKGYDNRFNS